MKAVFCSLSALVVLLFGGYPSSASQFVSLAGVDVPLPAHKPVPERQYTPPKFIVVTPSKGADAATFASGKVVRSENLLYADGDWKMVERSSHLDPAQAHIQARKNVDVKRFRKDKSLSAHFEPDAKSGEDGKLRILRVDHDDNIEWDQYDIEVPESVAIVGGGRAASQAELVSVKPISSAVAAPVISKLRVQEDVFARDMIVPPPLPARKVARVSNKSMPFKKPVKVIKTASGSVPIPMLKPLTRTSLVFENGLLSKQSVDVIKVRSGAHPGKVRLVIEVSEKTRYKAAIDPIRNVLRLKIDKANWTFPTQSIVTGSALLGSYVARKQADDSVLFEVRLRKQSRILNTMILDPRAGTQYRIVIDLSD